MKYVILNHKMNLEYKTKKTYAETLKKLDLKSNKLIVCPSDIYLTNFIDLGFQVGSQNASSNKDGAYTGEVSASQLRSLGVKYSLVGHSERRKYFKETNQEINKKIRLLLLNRIRPILCVGESLNEKNSRCTKEVIFRQLQGAFDKLSKENIGQLIIAYEPVWAIGSGKVPSNEEIERVVLYIKEIIYKSFKVKVDVVYGGSVNNENIELLKSAKGVDGYLLGGISLKLDKLQELINRL